VTAAVQRVADLATSGELDRKRPDADGSVRRVERLTSQELA
jgi:hypothetical protein